jgi:DNA polymerase
MPDSDQDLISRTIRFLNQQKEMYGEFSVNADIDLELTEQIIEDSDVQNEVVESKAQAETAVDHSHSEPEDTLEEPETEVEEVELSEEEKIAQCSTFEELRALCETSESLKTDLEGTNLVFGVGNPNADLMIVGEAPGFNENQQGEPFVGEAGQLLDKIMGAINFKREDIYIANILKHRPPENRDPKAEERAKSLPYLLKQIELVDPKLILCVGRISGTTLLGKDDTLKNMRSKFHAFNGRELMVTYHPAALLRNQQWKRPTWEDVQKLRDRYDELGGKP